jgi:SPP1 gp7 family putative phage head morphogenesis protein
MATRRLTPSGAAIDRAAKKIRDRQLEGRGYQREIVKTFKALLMRSLSGLFEVGTSLRVETLRHDVERELEGFLEIYAARVMKRATQAIERDLPPPPMGVGGMLKDAAAREWIKRQQEVITASFLQELERVRGDIMDAQQIAQGVVPSAAIDRKPVSLDRLTKRAYEPLTALAAPSITKVTARVYERITRVTPQVRAMWQEGYADLVVLYGEKALERKVKIAEIMLRARDEPPVYVPGGWKEVEKEIARRREAGLPVPMRSEQQVLWDEVLSKIPLEEVPRIYSDDLGRRASVIAIDQTLKLNSATRTAQMLEAGITEYTWRTVGDERVRGEHKALDGQRFKVGVGEQPGEAILCRCVAVPVVKSRDDREKERQERRARRQQQVEGGEGGR